MKKIFVCIMVLLWAMTVSASTADDISKNVNSIIRNAEKAFFKGKAEDASTLLGDAKAQLDALKKQAPDHRTLKSLQTKYDRLKAKVDKKLGAGSGATPQASSSGPVKSEKDKFALSSTAKGKLGKAAKNMDNAEREMARAEKSLKEGAFNYVKSYISNAGDMISSAGGYIESAVKNNKAHPEHPEVVALSGRLGALQAKFEDFKRQADAGKAGAQAAEARGQALEKALNEKWVPRLEQYSQPGSGKRLQYMGSHDTGLMEKQQRLYDEAKTAFDQVAREVPAGQQPHQLKRAVDALRVTLEAYDDAKAADGKNRLMPIESTLADWERRFEQNKRWKEGADMGPFVITPQKMAYQKKLIEDLKKTDSKNGNLFARRLDQLDKENHAWSGKKKKWMERPRPFPAAKMKSKKLQNQMTDLLEDRGIKVKDLVITDKDWWVQKGEFRFMAAAFLSKDSHGKYWSKASFRQMQTLAGYSPTEVWNIDDIRIRLP